jgi:hypothetical protein
MFEPFPVNITDNYIALDEQVHLYNKHNISTQGSILMQDTKPTKRKNDIMLIDEKQVKVHTCFMNESSPFGMKYRQQGVWSAREKDRDYHKSI